MLRKSGKNGDLNSLDHEFCQQTERFLARAYLECEPSFRRILAVREHASVCLWRA